MHQPGTSYIILSYSGFCREILTNVIENGILFLRAVSLKDMLSCSLTMAGMSERPEVNCQKAVIKIQEEGIEKTYGRQ